MNNGQTHERPTCGGKTRNDGKCKRSPAKGGNGRCKLHNGHAKRGIEASRYEGKGYSPYVPIPIGDTFADMQADPQLASVRDELALTKTFIAKHLEHYGTVDNRETLPELLNMIIDMKRYYRSSDATGMAMTIDSMENIITNRLEQLKTEDQIMERVEQQRRLVETEQRISLQGERAISVELFALLMGEIFRAIEVGVKDKNERIAVATKVQSFIAAGN